MRSQRKWAPLVHLVTVPNYVDTAQKLAEWAGSGAAALKVLGYAREVLEMAIKLMALDPRADFINSEDRSRIRDLTGGGPREVLDALRRLNRQIDGFGLDDWMLGASSSRQPERWVSPKLGRTLDSLSGSTPIQDLQDARRAVEIAIWVKCEDGRMRFLTAPETACLAEVVQLEPEALVKLFASANAECRRRGVGARTDLSPFVELIMDGRDDVSVDPS